MPYLSVHFKEKTTVDGEQVYFAISKDGFSWEQTNGGNPMITCTKGEGGCRDIEIVRLKDNSFVIIATDLCIVNRIDENGNLDWRKINCSGSKCLNIWRTDDLVRFSEQELMHMGRDDFGCLWAPEVFYDEINDEYLVHWGSTIQEDDYRHMSIYCSTTKDFRSFSEPKLFFTKENEILDSHIRKIGDTYHLFYKQAHNPGMNMHATASELYGPYEHDAGFEKYMDGIDKANCYEAPTTFVLPDGRWCFMADFFGCEKEKMGYVPFISPAPGDMNFEKCEGLFSFPYGFKHGGVIEITDEEYARLKSV